MLLMLEGEGVIKISPKLLNLLRAFAYSIMMSDGACFFPSLGILSSRRRVLPINFPSSQLLQSSYPCSIHTPLDRLALAPYGLHEKRKAYPIGLSIPLLLFVLADLLLSLQFLIPSHFQWVVTILKVLIVSCIFLWWRAPCELVFKLPHVLNNKEAVRFCNTE